MHEFRNGWRELLGAIVGLACGVGSFTPVLSLFLRPLEAEFGWSKTATAASLAALPLAALILPLAGRLLDRFGVRRVAWLSGLMLSACYLRLSFTDGRLGPYYVAFAALWVLGSATGPISYTRVISQRFLERRGAALAIALLGVAAAGVVLPPLIGQVLASSGWRGGYRLLAATAFVGCTLAVLLIRTPPEDESARPGAGLQGRPALMRQSSFWLLGTAVFCITAASLGFVSQFQSVLAERGIDEDKAPVLLSLIAASVFVSRIIVGWLLDFARAEQVAAGVTALAGVGVLAWAFGPPTFTTALVAVVLIAMSIGGELDLMSFFCARLFGVRHYAASYGALSIFFYWGIASGGIGYGLVHDAKGTYDMAIGASGVLFFVAAVLMLALRSASDRAIRAASVGERAGGFVPSTPHAPGALTKEAR